MVGHQQHLVGKDVLCLAQFMPVLILQICFLAANQMPLYFILWILFLFYDAVLVHKNLLL